MNKIKKENSGFTLIELLVVIGILGALSALAVNGYTQYRRSALSDLAADNLLAQALELRDRTVRGKVGAERRMQLEGELKGELKEEEKLQGDLKCWGLYFEKESSGDFSVKRFSQDFLSERVWDDFEERWVYRGCGEFNQTEVDFETLEMDEAVRIVNVETGRGNNFAAVPIDFVLRFMPPEGKVDFQGGDEVLKLTIQYGESDDERLRNEVLIDLI